MWKATVLTLFPEMFPGPLGHALAGKALREGLWQLETIDIRTFSTDKHRTVDDTPFGGGPGMVLRPDVVDAALDHATAQAQGKPHYVYLTPRGKRLTQSALQVLAFREEIIFLCGHYEGVDQRVIDAWPFEEISIGDFVLSGGEVAAHLLLDGVVRLLPGVIGDAASLEEESFSSLLLEYPHYTRPQVWQERTVPDVLISGHHRNIATWRKEQAEALTQQRRPDLWQLYQERASLHSQSCNDKG